MSDRPKDLPALDSTRLNEIRDLLTYESSIGFHSARAHESMWILFDFAERGAVASGTDRRSIAETIVDAAKDHAIDGQVRLTELIHIANEAVGR